MSLSSFAFMSETLNAESCFKKLCIFLTGYAPYAPCLSTPLRDSIERKYLAHCVLSPVRLFVTRGVSYKTV